LTSDVARLAAEGEQAFRAGNAPLARSLFERVIAAQPRHSRANECLAYIAGQAGQWDAAQRFLTVACEDSSASPQALFHLGSLWLQREQPQDAVRCFQRALARAGDFFEGLHELGTAQSRAGDVRGALASYRKAAKLQPNAFQVHFNIGRMHDELGEPEQAIESYGRAIALQPAFAAAWTHRGIALSERRRHAEALSDHERATQADPQDPEAWVNLAVTLGHLRRHTDALAACDRAQALAPDHPFVLTTRGVILDALRRHGEALACHDRALALVSGQEARVIANRAECLALLDRRAEALSELDRALALVPTLAQAWSSRGILLAAAGRYEEALSHYDRALRLRPDDAPTLNNRGLARATLGRHADALADFERAMQLDPNIDYLPGQRLNARMALCDWTGLQAQIDDVAARIEKGERAMAPFPALAVFDSPELARRAAETWVRDRCPPVAQAAPPRAPKQEGDRIVLGYYSADFHDHATAYLMAEFFERHDKTRFELIAFSFGRDADDASRRRLRAAFDSFIDVRELSDEAVVKLSAELGVDNAIDLKGFTLESRPGIFARRAAPVQVSWLGYPGTTAIPAMDYVIADAVIVPDGDERHYSEKVVRLPHTYQVNDTRKPAPTRLWTRQEAGLPEQGVVFCCVNNAYQISPERFRTWMRILRRVEGSVLWLFQGEPQAIANLRREAAAAGVDPERLVFAGFVPLAEHLGRYALADVFLDTGPYNAHTTASDALWCGVPVITRVGEAFAGRVAASLLGAMQLAEGVAESEQAYEDLAIKWAKDPMLLAGLREQLIAQRESAPLFDIDRTTKAIERAFDEMVRRQWDGLAPDHLWVSS
jgi:predicted O-linked N-acetylglucosamine transferase (SPINDLY family)